MIDTSINLIGANGSLFKSQGASRLLNHSEFNKSTPRLNEPTRNVVYESKGVRKRYDLFFKFVLFLRFVL